LFDEAIARDVDEVYVTVFAKPSPWSGDLRDMVSVSSQTKSQQMVMQNWLCYGDEQYSGDVLKDYPLIGTQGRSKFLLAIFPKYHTQLLPDSILNNELSMVFRIYLTQIVFTKSISAGCCRSPKTR
jgi:hypothetical protein